MRTANQLLAHLSRPLLNTSVHSSTLDIQISLSFALSMLRIRFRKRDQAKRSKPCAWEWLGRPLVLTLSLENGMLEVSGQDPRPCVRVSASQA